MPDAPSDASVRHRDDRVRDQREDPDGAWMKQMARNLVDPVDGFLRGGRYLIHDRDPLFTEAFTGILEAAGVKSGKIPAQSPNCNPDAERFVKTIKYECLHHFVIFGERHLRHLIKEFVEHYEVDPILRTKGDRS